MTRNHPLSKYSKQWMTHNKKHFECGAEPFQNTGKFSEARKWNRAKTENEIGEYCAKVLVALFVEQEGHVLKDST